MEQNILLLAQVYTFKVDYLTLETNQVLKNIKSENLHRNFSLENEFR